MDRPSVRELTVCRQKHHGTLPRNQLLNLHGGIPELKRGSHACPWPRTVPWLRAGLESRLSYPVSGALDLANSKVDIGARSCSLPPTVDGSWMLRPLSEPSPKLTTSVLYPSTLGHKPRLEPNTRPQASQAGTITSPSPRLILKSFMHHSPPPHVLRQASRPSCGVAGNKTPPSSHHHTTINTTTMARTLSRRRDYPPT